MNCWKVLNINATKDKKEIKKAYAKQLPKYRPEEDNDGFMKLRQAYEEALRLADTEDEKQEEGPVEQWIAKVDAIYQNFAKRCDAASWQEVLDDDVCLSLDTQKECSIALLVYLAEHIMIPHAIFKMFDNYFQWSHKKTQLYELFPSSYIDYICNNAQLKDGFRYELLDKQLPIDYDAFLESYYMLENSISASEKEEMDEYLKKLEQFAVVHPDVYEVMMRANIMLGRKEKVKELETTLQSVAANDISILSCLAKAKFELEEYEQALQKYDDLLMQFPDNVGALLGKALCYKELKEYEQALACVKQAQQLSPGDGYVRNFQAIIYDDMVEKYRKSYNADKKNMEKLYSYCDALVESFRQEEAIPLLKKLSQEEIGEERYLRVHAKAYIDFENGDCEKAIPYLEKLIALCPDEVALYEDLGYCYCEEYRLAEAKEIFAKASALDKTSPRIYYRLAQVYIKEKEYDKAIAVCQEGMTYNPKLANFYHFQAEAYFRKEEYEKALALCDKALFIAPYADTYEIKIQILMAVFRLEDALKLIEKLEKEEFITDEMLTHKAIILMQLDKKEEGSAILDELVKHGTNCHLTYYQVGILAFFEKDYERALRCFKAAIMRTKEYSEEYYSFLVNTYLRLEDYRNALQVLQKIEEKEGPEVHTLRLIADIAQHICKYEMAVAYYRKVLALYPEEENIHRKLGVALYCNHQYEEGIIELEKQIAINGTGTDYGELGKAYWYWQKKPKALEYFLKAEQLGADMREIYSMMCRIYVAAHDWEKSLEYLIKTDKVKEAFFSEYLYAIKICAQLRRVEEAEYMIERGKRLDNFAVILASGCYYTQMGQYEKAEKWFRRSFKVLSSKILSYSYLAYNAIMAGEEDKALSYYQKALEEEDMSECTKQDMYRFIGEWYEIYAEDTKIALKYYQKAHEQDTSNAAACAALADMYWRMGKKKNLVPLYQQSWLYHMDLVKKREKTPEWINRFGLDCARLGDYDKAISCFAQAFEWYYGCAEIKNLLFSDIYYNIAVAMERKASQLAKKKTEFVQLELQYSELHMRSLQALKEHLKALQRGEWEIEEEGLSVLVPDCSIAQMEALLNAYEQADNAMACYKMALRYYQKAYQDTPIRKYQKAAERLQMYEDELLGNPE